MCACPSPPTRVAGEGSFAKVYEAQHRGRVVAVKTFKGKYRIPSLIEIAILFQLESKFLAKGIDIISLRGCYGFEEEYGITVDLASYSLEGKSVDSLRALQEIAFGVLELHKAGFLHLDIKPDNVLVYPSGKIALSDFGLSRKTANLQSSLSVSAVGTEGYIAPETEDYEVATGASDIYSLGITFIEILTRPSIDVAKYLQQARYQNIHRHVALRNLVESLSQSVEAKRADLPEWKVAVITRLIPRMVDTYPQNRPTAKEVCQFLVQIGGEGNSFSQIPEMDSTLYHFHSRNVQHPIPPVYLERILSQALRYPEFRAEMVFRALDLAVRFGDPMQGRKIAELQQVEYWVIAFLLMAENLCCSEHELERRYLARQTRDRETLLAHVKTIILTLNGEVMKQTAYDIDPGKRYTLPLNLNILLDTREEQEGISPQNQEYTVEEIFSTKE